MDEQLSGVSEYEASESDGVHCGEGEAYRSYSFTNLLHRVGHANDLSTIHRRGSDTKPLFA
ncbi:hypothetical protein ATPR_3018 [Acetobacter tropicalis NBRC 101654]|uniref:Uncharacterized protein n=1 Tax=Acetobacter tropicalis NBRC 101654 TaxID=749388 RepID=F7VI19_9PROT|nr:hypothetical protein ATPR_3018 [Acetobacter tropicalis NBRC 101654]